MSASGSAMDSARWFRQLAITAFEPYQAVKQRIIIVILDIGRSEQCQPSLHQRLRERTEAGAPMAILDEVAEDEAKAIEIKSETVSAKIYGQIANPKPSWVNPAIYALLAVCWAASLCSVIQVPFRIVPDDYLAADLRSGGEIAALPASVATRSMSQFRAQDRRQNAGYQKEPAGMPVRESRYKKQPVRERAFPEKPSRIGIRLGQLAQRK